MINAKSIHKTALNYPLPPPGIKLSPSQIFQSFGAMFCKHTNCVILFSVLSDVS